MIALGTQLAAFALQIAAFALAVHVARPALEANELLSPGPILLYLISATVLIAIGPLIAKITGAAAPAKKVGEGQRERPIPSIDFPTPDWLEPLTTVVNQKYINETVTLDGKSFQHCEFQDVTFLYNGTRPTEIGVGCKITGKRGFGLHSDNPLVLGVAQILQTFKTALGEKSDVQWNIFDRSSR
jgi:hypothetical protein